MPSQKQPLLYICKDAYGPLHVYDEGEYRYLTFGNDIQQSCLNLSRPYQLGYQYTQAMMLGLLLARKPKNVLLLGLGAGAMVHALRQAIPRVTICAVELREKVVSTALEWFQLPMADRHLNLQVADAGEFLIENNRQFDLIISDLFNSEAMDDQQSQKLYLQNCRAALTRSGCLIGNYWLGTALTKYALNDSLVHTFNNNVVYITTPEGNCVTFAFCNDLPDIRQQSFLVEAKALGERLSIPLQRHARNLLHENRLKFRLARKNRG